MYAQVRWCRPSVCLFIVLSALTFGTLPAASAGEVLWVEVRSPNFSVVTDTGEKRGREVAMRFEQMRAVFGTIMTKAKVNLAVPLQIVAFRNTKEMRQVAPLWNGKPTQLAGLFQAGQDRSFIMLDMSVENPYSVVFHEYAHQLMNGNLQEEVDPWFEEGFAEYFSSIEVDGKQVRVGKIPVDEYRVLQQFGMMKIADLFKVVHDSATYNESGDHRTSFYAGSAILMHYLYDNQLTAKIATYFQLKLNQHVPVEEAIQRAFGMSPPEFDKALRDYISAGRYRYYPVPTPPAISSDKFSVIPLKSTDSGSVLADIHLHSRDYQERARNEFQEILKADPNNAAACRGLGYGYLQQQDFTQAAEYFKRASQLDSKDPRVHYYYALLLLREGHLSSGGDAAVMAKELETAISIDPGFADSYALLAFAQMTAGDSAKALTTMQKALELSPRDQSYLYNLANVYLANRQPDQAIAILTSLRVTDNPVLAAQVAAMLAQARQFQQAMQTVPNASERGMLSQREGPDSGVPQEEISHSAAPSSASSAAAAPPRKDTKWGSPKFIHGILSSVDCSTEPAAVLTLLVGAKTLKLTLADRSQVIMIGSDQFSCTWNKRKVAVNYRESGTGETSVMSVELQ